MTDAMQLLADNKVVDAKVQDVADRYEVGDMLGEGRFSQVFSATRGKQSVALKAVDMATLEEDEEAVEALVQEVTALRRAYAASKGHVPKVHEVLQTAETVYVVMDQVRGCELFEMLEQGPLSESSARRLIAQLLSALSCLHKHHVVHRDVKPENLMVTDVDDPNKCRLVMVRTQRLPRLSVRARRECCASRVRPLGPLPRALIQLSSRW
jgi:serine/threonine protein kinase